MFITCINHRHDYPKKTFQTVTLRLKSIKCKCVIGIKKHLISADFEEVILSLKSTKED